MRRWHLVLATALASVSLAAAVVAMASPPRGGARYTGETSQDRKVSFRVTPEGDLVKRFVIARDLVCRRGTRRTGVTGHFTQLGVRIEVSRKGRFHAEPRVEGRGQSRIRSGRVCVRGAFHQKGRVMRGRYREVVRLRDGSLCRSGLVSFLARVRG